MRHYSFFDQLLSNFDQALKTLSPDAHPATRSSPADQFKPSRLSVEDARHVAALMRINHTGEVCAQALYNGQALTAKLPFVRKKMQQAALEEQDHLAWCEMRLKELNSHTSIFNPLWYGMSFALGALAGAAGDKFSLGFVAETEKQVSKHLADHMEQVPLADKKTHAVLQQMNTDELHHRKQALDAGGSELSWPIRQAMKAMSKIMTKTTYWI